MRRSLLRASGLMALLLLASKGMGFVRESVVAGAYGAGLVKDANTVAYILPALFLIMLGGLNGPFHLATMGAVTRLEAQGREDDVPGVLLTLILATAVLTGLLALAAAFGASGIISLTGPHLDAEAHALAVTQLRIMSPLIMIGGLIGVFCGVSNVRGKFANSSISPMVSSLAVIALVAFTQSPTAIAWGTLAGAVGQLGVQALPVITDWKAIAGPRPFRPAPWSHPGCQDMLRMLIPASLSSSIGTINVAIGTSFCSQLGRGAISVFNYSNLLIQLPLGILLTAMLVPMFPRLTEAAAKGDRPALFGWLNRGIETIALFTLPMTALFIALGEPMVRLAFERGRFSATDTRSTALVMAIVSLTIVAYGTRDLFTRVFYAQNLGRTPMFVTMLSIGFNLTLNALLVRYGLVGLATSTALVTVINMLLLGGLLARNLGGLKLGSSLPTVAKSLVAAIACGAVAWLIRGVIPGSTHVAALVQVGIAGGGAAMAYLGALWALRVTLVTDRLPWKAQKPRGATASD